MRRLAPALVASLALATLAPGRADADLTISFSSATVAPGGMATIDIYLTPTATTTLSSFGLELLITPQATATSDLNFFGNQPGPPTSNYVFTNSFDIDSGQPFWGAPPPLGTNYAGDTIAGGDMSDPPFTSFDTLNANQTYLLAAVQVYAPSIATPGDMFSISLVDDPMQTYFDDMSFIPLPYTTVPLPGMVLVSSVPEPSSLTMLAIAGVGGLLWRRRARA